MASIAAAQSELLNIKQAAAFLQVSEISLRRWTDSGKLNCYRVGGKRERRFRRSDLVSFLDCTATTGWSAGRAAGNESRSGITLEGLFIEHGNHLCSLYEKDAGRIKLSVPFLADGLSAGERCFLIAAGEARAHVMGTLADTGADVAGAMAEGRLVVMGGADSGVDMYNYLESQFLQATREGIATVRVLGDMGWAIDSNLDIEDLMSFETQYNHTLANRFPVVSLCQYDVRRFSGSGVLAALRNHEDTFRFPLARFVGM